jgi:hypothetical protein
VPHFASSLGSLSIRQSEVVIETLQSCPVSRMKDEGNGNKNWALYILFYKYNLYFYESDAIEMMSDIR